MIRPSLALHGFMPDNAFGAMQAGSSNPMYGNIGVQPGFQCAAGSYGMPEASMGMAGFSQPDARTENMAGEAYDYKEGGQAVKFDTFHGTHDKLKALLFLQQFDAAFAGGIFTESSKIRKAATFLKTNALQWWITLLNQGVVPSTWIQFKQILALAWITSTFEVDVMTAWNQLSAINCDSLEEYNAKLWYALLPVSSFKMVPLAEQIEKYCCGLPKGIKKYCTKTSVLNMAQLIENAGVADDLIQGKPDEDGFKTRHKEPQGKQFSARIQNEGNTPRNKLEEIIWNKNVEVSQMKEKLPLSSILQALPNAPPSRDFIGALQRRAAETEVPALIAEVKKASPSKGVRIAQAYEEGGAACISVLTDRKYFQGDFEYLKRVRSAGIECPLLCKEFIIDAWQLYFARLHGADAVLLIAAVLPDQDLRYMPKICKKLGLAALVEVYFSTFLLMSTDNVSSSIILGFMLSIKSSIHVDLLKSFVSMVFCIKFKLTIRIIMMGIIN
ncbi:hypothetical protein L7F22_002600 [Adiantum nelumboides]|nr:hypothetical protein [Adiantum nelumboides]